MTVSKAIRAGLAATRRAKFLVFIFYACNLLVAAVVAAPMHDAIKAHLGNSKMSEELVRGLNSAWLTEFQIANEGFLRGFSTAIVYAGVVFLLLNTILSAGAFEVFVRGEGAGMHAFGRGVGKYFARFVRLAILASLLYFIAFWFWNGPVDGWIRGAWRQSALERTQFYLLLARDVLLVFTVFVLNAMIEYAKADLTVHQRRSAFAALMAGMGFVLRRLGRVLGIYLGIAILTGLAIAAYVVFAIYYPLQSASVWVILGWLLVAQVLLWLRWMFRLSSWGAAVAFYQAQLPAAELLPEQQPAAEAAAQV